MACHPLTASTCCTQSQSISAGYPFPEVAGEKNVYMCFHQGPKISIGNCIECFALFLVTCEGWFLFSVGISISISIYTSMWLGNQTKGTVSWLLTFWLNEKEIANDNNIDVLGFLHFSSWCWWSLKIRFIVLIPCHYRKSIRLENAICHQRKTIVARKRKTKSIWMGSKRSSCRSTNID